MTIDELRARVEMLEIAVKQMANSDNGVVDKLIDSIAAPLVGVAVDALQGNNQIAQSVSSDPECFDDIPDGWVLLSRGLELIREKHKRYAPSRSTIVRQLGKEIDAIQSNGPRKEWFICPESLMEFADKKAKPKTK